MDRPGGIAITEEQDLVYREAVSEYPELMVPVVRLYAAGSGPFEGSGERIKHRYLG